MADLVFPLKNDTSRKIIHIDMDAFFASVEERDDPELAKHPLVIARHPSDTGGKGDERLLKDASPVPDRPVPRRRQKKHPCQYG